MMIKVNVKLFATFRTGRFAAALREYPEGTSIAEVIRELHIPEILIGMIMLNNQHAEPGNQVKDGDSLALFPLLGGG